MLVTPDCQVRHAQRHLARLEQSAHSLDFHFNHTKIRSELNAAIASRTQHIASRLRLTLFQDGYEEIISAPLAPLPDSGVDLLVEEKPLSDSRQLATHKTTLREEYDQGVRNAEARGAFDSLFFTEDGRLVEGGRCNIFVRVDGRWWTPPLSDGALPGIMRALLLEDSALDAGERTLRLADIRSAQSFMVCNALRGAVPARLIINP